MLHGALVTFRRPEELTHYLAALAHQTRRLDTLAVIDNDPSKSGWDPLRRHLDEVEDGAAPAADEIVYLPQAENLGSAGGWSLGQLFFAQTADDGDWIVLLDDDDPPHSDTKLAELEKFAESMVATDPRTAAVAGRGAFFDGDAGRVTRLVEADLRGPVRVDYVGCGKFPLYRVAVIRRIGTFLPDLFLGYVELEYALRLKAADLHLYVDGDELRRRKEVAGTLRDVGRVRSELKTRMPPWRVYYTTRNLIWMLRSNGHYGGALRVSVRRGLGRGVSQVFVSPRQGRKYILAGLYGIRDGWRGQLGRPIDPQDAAFRAE